MTSDVRPRAAIVVNPTKLSDVDETRENAAAYCAEAGWSKPVWLETTADDPGFGQAKVAMAQEIDVIMALGGDGTIRAVARAVAGTSLPMGVIAMGTGNLLARNLRLPLNDVRASIKAALSGDDLRIDAIDVRFKRVDGSVLEDAYLVMAGVGFDAEIMENTSANLKKQIGHAAYTVSGLQRLIGPTQKVSISVDGSAPKRRRVRSLLVGNCGELFGGLSLIPNAAPDNGRVSCVVLSPQGLLGWASVAWQVLSRRRNDLTVLEYFEAKRIRATITRPMLAQVDGDPVGEVTQMEATVRPQCITVRVASADPISSLVNAAEAQEAVEQARSGQIDLRPFDPGNTNGHDTKPT